MKKRRELDALVNGKLSRKKKKGDHELLRNDSESSEIDEFSIPQKSVIRKRTPGRLCSICSTCMTVCAFFILVTCVIGIVVLGWIHIDLKKDLDQLRQQVNKVDTGSQSSVSEVQAMQSSVQRLEAQVAKLTIACQKQNKTISDLKEQLTKVQKDTTSLSYSIGTFPELKGLPDKITRLTKEHADLGSKVASLKEEVKNDDVNSDITSLKTRMSALETKVNTQLGKRADREDEPINGRTTDSTVQSTKASSRAGEGVLGATVQQLLNNVRQLGQSVRTLNGSMQMLNSSVQAHFMLVNSHMDQHSNHLELLTNKTENLQNQLALVRISGPNTTTIVQGVVKAVMNILKANKSLETASPMAVRADVLAKVDNITAVVQELKNEFTQLSDSLGTAGSHDRTAVTGQEIDQYLNNFSTYKVTQEAATQALNNSLRSLNTTVQMDVLPQLKAHSNHLNNLQQQVADLSNTRAVTDSKNEDTPSPLRPTENPGLPKDVTKSTTPIVVPDEESTQSTFNRDKRSVLLFNKGLEETAKNVLHSDLLKNAAAVKILFSRADTFDEGKVDYDTLKGFLGPNLPPEEQLNRFDTDFDGYFTRDELLAAFGFTATTTQKPDRLLPTEAVEQLGSTGYWNEDHDKEDTEDKDQFTTFGRKNL